MDTEGWELAKKLFHKARLLEPEDRRRLLAGVDPAVRQEVEGLLGGHEEAGPEPEPDVVEPVVHAVGAFIVSGPANGGLTTGAQR